MSEIPYPEKGDILFKGDSDIALNADISHWNKDLHGYAKGYKEGADYIVKGVIENPRSVAFNISYLVFPIVFLYRQYLELRLKEIILLGTRLKGKPEGFPKHHRIDELWAHARPHIEEVSLKGLHEELDATEKLVKEFGALDPDGMAFRYPVDPKGKMHLPEWTVINLRRLGDTMQKIGNLLDGASECLYIGLQQVNEFRDYF